MHPFTGHFRLRSVIFLLFFLLISSLGVAVMFISYEGSFARLQMLSKHRLQLVAEQVDNQITRDYFLTARSIIEHSPRSDSVLPLIFNKLEEGGKLNDQIQFVLLDKNLNLLDSNHPSRELSPSAYQPGMHISQFQKGELSLFSRLLLIQPELLKTGWADWQNARWQVHLHRMTLGEDKEYWIGVAEPLAELLADVYANMNLQLIIMLSAVLLAYGAAWWLSGRVAESLVKLMKQSQAMRRFQFNHSSHRVSSRLLEVNELGESVYALQSTLEHFMSLIRRLSKTRDLNLLANELSAVIRKLYGGDGAMLWLPDNEDSTCYKLLVNQGMSSSNHLLLLSPDKKERRTFDEAIWRWFSEQNYSCTHLELIELKDRFGENMGWICVYFGSVPQIDESVRALVESYLQFATLALESQRMLQQRKELFNSLIEMIASAIDAKSKYTGGHCQRVPDLALDLAKEACDCKEGSLADFQLTDDQWEALHIAAWMHDCGKVTTPEYIVDKATKLETIHNRIHEIRTRFEVIKRDKKIEALERQLSGQSPDKLNEWLSKEWQQLDDDFAFIAECNSGHRRMESCDLERIDQIASKTWLRTLDDSLGLAHEELARKTPTQLPCKEPLLADKDEHLIPHFNDYSTERDLEIGVKRDIPRYKANRGECYNLKIPIGTLTAEDRFKVNDHIVQTIRMLKRLPYPEHLRSVPDIAGAHHERIDGKGYPRQLAGAEIPVTARILAIADIFEALTAADRPYKKAKPLDEALAIMRTMADTGHIDTELFQLFLRSEIYQKYAQVYLPQTTQQHPVPVQMAG